VLFRSSDLVAPAILALSYSYYSDRGDLLARTKGLQLVAFVALALLLTPRMGPLGMALAVVATDLVVQFGFLASAIMRDTLQRPARHVGLLLLLIVAVTACGWALGLVIRSLLPMSGLARLVAECALWLIVVAIVASPLASARLRTRVAETIPS